ncbi:MAG: hypothetical protein ACSHW7_11070 [Patiriisocius sp.]|uniref:hypothetical protein n=1 Tax=Patiriisocius sp. TaxID=2822396 RepID=UPI003EF678E4
MKIGVYIFAITFALSAVLGCEGTSNDSSELYEYLPEGTTLVYKISQEDATKLALKTLFSEFENNRLLSNTENSKFNAAFISSPIIEQIGETNESILAFSNNESETPNAIFITKQPRTQIILDSIKDKKVETLRFDDNEVTKLTVSGKETFYTAIDSTMIVSTSLNSIKNSISKKVFKDSTFQKLIAIPSKKVVTVLKKNNKKNAWTSLHISQDETSIQASGVLIERDSIKPLLSHFKNQVPQELTLTSIIPNDTKSVTIFTYSDAELLLDNLRKFNKDSTKVASGIAELFNEIGHINWQGNSFVFAKSIDAQIALENLQPQISEVKEFRNTTIYNFNSPSFFKTKFNPIVKFENVDFMFEVNGYFIFCPSEISAENMSTAIMSDAVLSKSATFKDIASNLTRSISYCEIATDEDVAKMTNGLLGNSGEETDFKKVNGYDLAIEQYTFENNFAHVNFVTDETSNDASSIVGVSVPNSFKISEAILGNPIYFEVRGNRKKNIAFQDIKNTLRGYSITGEVSWSKKLDNPILGDIQEVDVNRNGKKQLAFVTKNKMYVVDENGKDVAPFPISYKDQITQPLAVFDYDNSRKYRFIIIQDNEVIMLDGDGKSVKGFTFKKAKSEIIATPQHIRLGNKDYLLFQEKSGKINILSRTGKERIKISETFKLNGRPIQKDGDQFVLITADNEEKIISQSGKVTTKKPNVETDYSYKIDARMKVSLNDNLLRMNGKLVELPFGIYTKPNLFYFNKTGYVTVTETQENKVYLYTSNGTLVNGFPVYGTSSATLTDVSKSKSLQLLVKGDEKELLSYTIN